MLTVCAPASSGNLGSGFDALSMTLELCNHFSVEPAAELTIENRGLGADVLASGPDHLAYRALAKTFAVLGKGPPPLRLRCENRIPLSRGLGSSSTAICAGLLLGNRLQGDPLSLDQLLALATEMEGHPDNVAACLLGGVQVSVTQADAVLHSSVPINLPLQAVVFVPELVLNTADARRVLPRQVPLADAVFNLGRAALLVAALANGEPELLRAAMDDRLHQPPRTPLFPAMPALFQAALAAGAVAACLSGAGSTILALAIDQPERVAAGLEAAARRHGVPGTVRLLAVRTRGAEFVEDDTR